MTRTKQQTISEQAWGLARRQHGVVARRQLLELGLGDEAIQHRLGNGRLHRLDRGVYAVGRSEVSCEGRWMAAVLAAGSGAVLSHGSAAELWGVLPGSRRRVEVSIPAFTDRKRKGVEIHRRPKLRDSDVTEHRGIPVTKPIRTMIDVAHGLDSRRLERAVNEADRLDLVDPVTLFAALADYPGQKGVGSLKALLGDHVLRLTDSELERRFLRLVGRARLPLPETQRHVNGFRVDFYWPDLGLVVETDGLHYHRTPAQQARDRRRDQAHTAAGLAHLRFTHAQVRYEPEQVAATLAATVRVHKLERR